MAGITKDTKVGGIFTGKTKKVSWERLWTFSGGPLGIIDKESLQGWPRKNIHTSLEFARNCGMPDKVAASATQYMGYTAELMIDLFGEGWLSSGSMDTRFVRIVDAGDILVTKATVGSVEAKGNATKFTMEVTCDNQKGEAILVGGAVGYLGKPELSEAMSVFQSQMAELKAICQPAGPDKPQLAPMEYTVTPELNQQYLFAEEDFNPRYIEGVGGQPVGHPGLILNFSNDTRSPTYKIPPGQGGLHARDQAFFINPARVGSKLKVTWDRLGSFERRGRPYEATSILVADQEGREIIRRLSYGTVATQQHQVKV